MPPMTYRALGRCGMKVSSLSLGGWTTFGGSITSERTTRAILHAAYDAGINFFDIADVYARGAAEEMMGKALASLPRRHLVLSSKVYWPMSDDINDRGLSRKHIMSSIEQSLRRMGTDHLDLYFCHRYDLETPLEETVRAMDDLVRQGKVLYWGTSEWTGPQLRQAHELAARHGGHAPQVEQPQYNLLVRGKVEGNVRPAAEELGMGLVVWSPLASGVLTGKYDDGVPDDTRLGRIGWLREQLLKDESLAKVRGLRPIAERLGTSRAALSLAWTLAQPAVSSVILGATSVEQLEENLEALSLSLDDSTLREIDAMFPVREV